MIIWDNPYYNVKMFGLKSCIHIEWYIKIDSHEIEFYSFVGFFLEAEFCSLKALENDSMLRELLF